MIIEATLEEVKQMALLAINASFPVGLGVLHAENKNYTIEDLDKWLHPYENSNNINIDYFHGRMVKFYTFHNGSGYVFDDNIITIYQSWAHKYPSYRVLHRAAKEAIEKK